MNKSESINELAGALAKAQGEMRPALFDKDNLYFKTKYASLKSCWDACREPLSKNGLAIIQSVYFDQDKPMLDTMLVHVSGQWISSTMLLRPAKNDMQGLAGALTYAKRYALAALVGIVSDEDDDGNEDSKGHNSGVGRSWKKEEFGKYEASVGGSPEREAIFNPSFDSGTSPEGDLKKPEYIFPKGQHAGKTPKDLADATLEQYYKEMLDVPKANPEHGKHPSYVKLMEALITELADRHLGGF